MEKLINIIVFSLLFIWQLPQNIVALVMMPFLGKLTLLSYREFCLCFIGSKMQGGISLGNFAFVSPRSAKNAAVVAHEQLGHTVDSKIMGPFYLLFIGIPSLIWAAFYNEDKHPDYYSFYTERMANYHAGVESYEVFPNIYMLRFKS